MNLLKDFALSLPRKPWEYTVFQKLRNGWFSQGIFRAKSKWENYVEMSLLQEIEPIKDKRFFTRKI